MTTVRLMALLVASLVALPLLSGGEARAQTPAACTATATVSATADSDNVYTTTLACADTAAADGAADYTHLPYYSQGRAHHRAGLPGHPIANNNQKNHLSMTIGDGVVFSGTNTGSGASDERTLVLESEGDLTFTVEEGGVIRANQAVDNWWNVGAGLYLVTDTGDLTVTHAGVIELAHSFPSTAVVSSSTDPNLRWNEYGSDGNGISVVAVDRHFYGDTVSTYNAAGGNGVNGGDIEINLLSTGVIRNKAGSAGGNGIDARQRTELGGIHIDLAAGSTIDVSAEGGRGVLGQIFKQANNNDKANSDADQSGEIRINARGTIKAAVKRKSGSRYQGAGIVALSTSSGAIRIASSGTIETVQAPAILAWPSGTGNPLDNPVTRDDIEGNLIDVTGGRIETRGNSAIFAQFGTGSTVMTVRVADGATVRAEGMAGPGAITKAQYESCNVEARLGCRYAEGARPVNKGRWWIRSDTDDNGEFDTIVPFVNGITVQGLAVPAEGAVSRVLIDGVVEVVEGSPVTADENDEELGYAGGHGVYLSHGGTVEVGKTGRISVSTASGAAIHSATGDLAVAVMGTITSASGAAIHSETGDLVVAVTGTVDGDIRGLGSGEHTVTVSEGGAVTGTTRLAGSGTVRMDGAVGPVRLDSGGTVAVGRTGRVGADSGLAIASGSAPPESPAADYEAPESDLTVTVAAGGRVTGDIRVLDAGDLMATIAGMVTGDIEGLGSGEHTVTVSEGGAVTGTTRLASSGTVRADGAVGPVRLDSGGTVTVGRTGEIKSASGAAIHGETGGLAVAVMGTVDGDIRGLGSGEHTVTVSEGGAVTGTTRLASSGTVRADGAVGPVRLDSGGTVAVGRTGRITSASGAAGAAIHSETGDLVVAVMGMVDGDIRGLGSGEHTVTVSEGGAVTGAIRLAGSTVRVDGKVGSVRLDSGGMVTVGRTGRITSASGAEIHSKTGNLAVTVMGTVDGDVRGLGSGEHTVTVTEGGAVTGAVRLAGSSSMVTVGPNSLIGGGISASEVTIQQGEGESAGEAGGRAGLIDADVVAFQKPGGPAIVLVPPDQVSSVMDGPYDVFAAPDGRGGVRVVSRYAPRSRVYEALPSVLLGLNVLPTHWERLAAARSPNGAWARVWAGGGEREERSTSTAPARLAYDHNRSGVQAGVDIPSLGEDAVGGVSVHHVRGKADLSGGDGKIEATGTGLGVSGAWRFDDGVYVDAQVSATWYEADLTSGLRGSLKSGTGGFGYALGLEAGRRIGLGPGPLGDLTATPRARLVRSEVDMDDFTDSDSAGGSRVSLERGRSVTGRAGVNLEASIEGGGLLFGSVEVEREFAGKTRIEVEGYSLESEPDATRARIELGGAYAWDEGAYALKGAAHVVQGRRDNRDWGGGLSLAVRF